MPPCVCGKGWESGCAQHGVWCAPCVTTLTVWQVVGVSVSNCNGTSSPCSISASSSLRFLSLGDPAETDYTAVGCAVTTISSNLTEMSRGVKLLAALLEDEGGNGRPLLQAAKGLAGAVSELLRSAQPASAEVRGHRAVVRVDTGFHPEKAV
jgi:hypothetical protein